MFLWMCFEESQIWLNYWWYSHNLTLIVLMTEVIDAAYKNSIYRKISNISSTKSPNLTVSRLVLQCLWPIQWSQVLSRELRCSWSRADRRCSNYIWVIGNCIARQGAAYMRDLAFMQWSWDWISLCCYSYLPIQPCCEVLWCNRWGSRQNCTQLSHNRPNRGYCLD